MKDLHFCECCGYLCVEEENYHGYDIIDGTLLCMFCSTAYIDKVEPLYSEVKDTLAQRRLGMETTPFDR